MAKRDWKKAIEEALDTLGEQVQDFLDALEGLFAPPPELIPVPVRPNREPPRR